jgi:ureidoacrylate peracid hydrolase
MRKAKVAERARTAQRRGVPQFALDAVLRRRGRVRVFQDLDPARMALLIIDMQEFACAMGAPVEVPAARAIVPTLNRLTHECRRVGVPVIWVVHANLQQGNDWRLFYDNFMSERVREVSLRSLVQGTEGTRIYHELEVSPRDFMVDKGRFSAFTPGSSRLARLLQSLQRDTVIVAGTKTNICCESTARDAMMLDYKVIFLSDGTAAATDFEHEATLANICQNFGDVLETDELIAIFNTVPRAAAGAR